MASSIGNSLFCSLDHVCLIFSYRKPHQMKQALARSCWGEHCHQNTAGTTSLLEHWSSWEFETVINIFLYFCRKILEVKRGMEFNNWLEVFYIQLFGSIAIQLLWIFWLQNTELTYHLLKPAKTKKKKKKSFEDNIVFALKVILHQEICSTPRSGDSWGQWSLSDHSSLRYAGAEFLSRRCQSKPDVATGREEEENKSCPLHA